MIIIIIIYLACNKKYCNKKVLPEAAVNLYFHFSLVNLCDRELLYDIWGEITVIILLENGTLSAMLDDLLSEKVPEESIGQDETKALPKTSHEQCIITRKRKKQWQQFLVGRVELQKPPGLQQGTP